MKNLAISNVNPPKNRIRLLVPFSFGGVMDGATDLSLRTFTQSAQQKNNILSWLLLTGNGRLEFVVFFLFHLVFLSLLA